MLNLKMAEHEFINDLPDIVRSTTTRGKYTNVLNEWLHTDAKTVRFICRDRNERESARNACNVYRKKYNANFVVWSDAKTYDIYCVKA